MVPLARRNLLAEKGRFAMSAIGVAFAVLLILIVVSLYRGWSGTGPTRRSPSSTTRLRHCSQT